VVIVDGEFTLDANLILTPRVNPRPTKLVGTSGSSKLIIKENTTITVTAQGSIKAADVVPGICTQTNVNTQEVYTASGSNKTFKWNVAQAKWELES
jgi:hypothetical protein